MALADEVANRWSSQILINASNPQNSGATTLDTTRRDSAVSDVQAAFKIYAGAAYDNTADTHIMVATEGVLIRLLVLTGQASREIWETWKKELRSLSLIDARDRISPSTDSVLTPTGEDVGDLPATDLTNWKDYIPNAPNGPTVTD